MGVPGLWDLIRHTGKPEALAQLALQGFRRDNSVDPLQGLPADTPHPRALRIGIDASIWFFHAAYGREGENPELRTLFFRLAKLASFTFCPLFVFDGPQRPKTKRGKTINTRMNSLAPGMKNMISAFGFEWRTAPGEAEAELAYLNNTGVIDAILSDDVDNFLFGARVVIRNPSGTLSGNRSNPVLNRHGKDDGMHVMVYRAVDIEKDPACRLTRGGMILIGLLSGGDYDQGAKRCGPKTALALAQIGLGDELLDAFQTLSPERFADYIPAWKDAVVEALRSGCATMGDDFVGEDGDEESQETAATASQGDRISASQRSAASISGSQQKAKKPSKSKTKKPPARRQPALAAEIAASDFPDLAILREYCAPWTSETAFAGAASSSLDDQDFPTPSQGSVITSSQRSTASNSKSRKKASAALTINSVGSGGLTADVRIGWTGELALGALGRICEQYFEWGVREIIQLRFRTLLWPAVVLRVLRRSIMEQERVRAQASRAVTPRPSTPTRRNTERTVPGTPRRLVNRHFGGGDSDSGSGSDTESERARAGIKGGDETPKARRTIPVGENQVDSQQLLKAIKGEREHVSTDGLREFRVEVAPKHLARLAVRELLGTRDPALLAGTLFDMEATPKGGEDDEDNEIDGDEETPVRRMKMVDAATMVRVWVPAELVQAVHPELVRAWEERGTKSKSRTKPAGSASTSTARRKVVKDLEGDGTAKKGGPSTKARGKAKEKENTRLAPTTLSGDEIEEAPRMNHDVSRGSPPCEPPSRSKSKPQPVGRSGSGSKSSAAGASLLKSKDLPAILSGDEAETEVLVPCISPPQPEPSLKPPSRPKITARSGSGSKTSQTSDSAKTSYSKTPFSTSIKDIARDRSSSPSLVPERSSSPVPIPPPISRRPANPQPTIPKKALSRIPGIVDVPSPPRGTFVRAGPASDSSELEDVSFRALLTRPNKRVASEPDSDSESDAGAVFKSSRQNRTHTSPRASSGSENEKALAKKDDLAPIRRPVVTKAVVSAHRPTTRSQSSSGTSEVEVLDRPVPSRSLKRKSLELGVGKDRVGSSERKVATKSHERTSPRGTSASESEGRAPTACGETSGAGKRTTGVDRLRIKAGSSSIRTKPALARAVDAVIDIVSSSDDSFVLLPPSITAKISTRPSTGRIAKPGKTVQSISRLGKTQITRAETPSFPTIDVANTSILDLISD